MTHSCSIRPLGGKGYFSNKTDHILWAGRRAGSRKNSGVCGGEAYGGHGHSQESNPAIILPIASLRRGTTCLRQKKKKSSWLSQPGSLRAGMEMEEDGDTRISPSPNIGWARSSPQEVYHDPQELLWVSANPYWNHMFLATATKLCWRGPRKRVTSTVTRRM